MLINNIDNTVDKKKISILVLIGALSLFLGTANPFFHVPLLILGFPAAIYLLAMQAQSARKAFYYGWLTGTIGVALGMYWLVIPVNVYGGFPVILSIPIPIVMGILNSIYTGLIAVILYKGKCLPDKWQVIFSFFVWYAVEWFRAWFLTGFTWMNIAAASAAFPILIQLASVVGMEALSAFYAFIGTAFATNKRNMQALGLLALVFAVGFGYVRMQGDLEKDNIAKDTFLLVQGNISQELKWDPEMQEKTLDKYLGISSKAVDSRIHEEIDVVVYPETALPFYLQNENEFHKQIKLFTQKYQIPIISGGVTYKRGLGKINLFNSAFLIKPDAKDSAVSLSIGQVYSKQHLLPFGEYIPPFLDLKVFAFVFEGIGAFTPGKYQPLLSYNGHEFGMLICYEAIFSYLAQESVEKGAQVFVNISNDAWYGNSSAAKQHLDLSVLRAVEQNRYLVRSTNTGITAFVNPYGEVLSSTELFVDASLVHSIGYRDVKSLYYYISAYLPYVLNLIFLVFVCTILRSSVEIGKIIKRRVK